MTDEHTPQGEQNFRVQANMVGAIGPGAHGEVHQHIYPPAAPPPASRPSRDWLPLQPNPLFQERPGEFEALEQLLFGQNGSGRVGLVGVGVVGMGGVGKTYLAVEVVERYKDRFPDGRFWMTATGSRLEWQRELARLAENTRYLPSDDDPGKSDNEHRRARHFARYLAEHEHALLVLDNVEHPELITSVLPDIAGAPLRCALLYTARVQDTPTGFHAHAVDRLTEEGALRLLLEEYRPAQLAEALAGSQSAEAQAARDLCRKVEGLPLALMHLRGLLKSPASSVGRLLQAISERGTNTILKDVLFKVFSLSWEQIKDGSARRLFVLAGNFPEAAPIPLWLVGLAAGLGEASDPWEPLGEASDLLVAHSLVELLADGAIRLHPLVREFAQSTQVLPANERQRLIQDAGERMAAELADDLGKLEARARAVGYWGCLEQVRTALAYADLLETERRTHLARIERWLDRESIVLCQPTLWPEYLPGLFYQQLANRAVEEQQPGSTGERPERWVHQLAPVGAENPALVRLFASYQSAVTSVTLSSDSKLVLAGFKDRTARLWEAGSGKLLLTLEGHQLDVTSLAFSPDSKYALTGSKDRTARLWEADSRNLLLTLEGHQSDVTGVAFSPDGKQMLTGSRDRTARLWEAGKGKLLLALGGHQWDVESVAFSPDGGQVLTAGSDGAMLWDASSGNHLLTLKGNGESITSAAFSPDGKQILTGSKDGLVRLWEASYRKQPVSWDGHEFGIACAAFSSDGRLVITGSRDQTARLWEVSSGMMLHSLASDQMYVVTSVAFSPNGKLVITDAVFTAYLWEVSIGKLLFTLTGHRNMACSVMFSPDGNLVLAAGVDGIARLWDTSSGKLMNEN
jgi:WD40 repeat protein